MLTVVFIFSGLVIGVTSAQPSNAIEIDPISDMVCTNIGDGHAYLGGIATPIIDGFKGKTAAAPWEGMFGINSFPKDDRTAMEKGEKITHEWTALERYGTFGVQYTNWVGMQSHYPLSDIITAFMNSEEIPWMGTGGKSAGFGSLVWIKNPKTALMYSQGVMDCVPIASHANVTIANIIQSSTQMTTATAINLYSISSNLSLTDKNSYLKPLGDVFELIIKGDGKTKGLKDLLFMDFIVVMLLFGAIVLAVTGLFRGAGTSVLSGALWMTGVSVVGILLLSNPLFVSSIVEKTVNTVTQVISSSALKPQTSYKECSLSSKEDGSMRSEREIGCVIWMENVYKPWVEGQFGMPYEAGLLLTDDPNLASDDVTRVGEPEEADEFTALNSGTWAGINKTQDNIGVGADLLGEGKVTPLYKKTNSLGMDISSTHVAIDVLFGGVTDSPVAAPTRADGKRGVFESFNPTLGVKPIDSSMKNWPFYQMHTTSSWPMSTGLNFSEIAYNQLMIDGNTAWKNADNAIPSAFTGVFLSLLPNITIIILAGSLAIMQITLSFLIILAPFFFLIGVIPGAGRNVLFRWVELLLEIVVKRVILTLFFMVFLKLYFVIIDSPDLSPFLTAVLSGVLAFVIITQRHVIVKSFTDLINLNTGAARAFGGEDENIAAVKRSGNNVKRFSRGQAVRSAAAVGFGAGTNMGDTHKEKRQRKKEQDEWEKKRQRERDRKYKRRTKGSSTGTGNKSGSGGSSKGPKSKGKRPNTSHSSQGAPGGTNSRSKGQSGASSKRGPQGGSQGGDNPKKPTTARAKVAGAFSTASAALAARAGVAKAAWGNTVERLKVTGSEARKAQELRALARQRKQVLAARKAAKGAPDDRAAREALSKQNRERKEARDAARRRVQEERQKRSDEAQKRREERTQNPNSSRR